MFDFQIVMTNSFVSIDLQFDVIYTGCLTAALQTGVICLSFKIHYICSRIR